MAKLSHAVIGVADRRESSLARVLVVDNEAGIRHIVRLALERINISVLEAADPHTALAMVLQSCPDLVIADVLLPGLDGVELTRRVRTIHPRLPVIFISASAQLQRAAVTAQVNLYLEKPFKLQTLQQKVQQILGHPGPTSRDGHREADNDAPRDP